ncbi:hypothetical protein A8709_02450 [Paenibacillus pectinilyticus]|uniref:Permease n=2 Tax=Paenibacillus pectinilyticus TaxID=512399 RepID=A0A1C1A6W9_9BACL|nr:hypothetical protein A8709_02450 [Paenibacillus pectinilyticus]
MQPLSIAQVITVMCLTALSALAAHLGKAVFHDGVRPILPEVLEGRMSRRELAGIAYGLSFGFIFSVGISFAFSFRMLNPWLLFLPTDILGILAVRRWIAAGLGAIWGGVALLGLTGILSALTELPVDLLGPLGDMTVPFMLAISVYPLVAILNQFGWKRALFSAVVVLVVRQLLVVHTDSSMFLQVSSATLVAVVLLLCFVVYKALAERRELRRTSGDVEDTASQLEAEAEERELVNQQAKKVRRGLPLFIAIGSCTAIACNLGIFTGSDAAMPFLHTAWANTGEARSELILSAALIDVIRLVSFIPLLVTTALATGVYGLVGLMVVFPIGYLSPNPVVAGVLGAIVIGVEAILLTRIATWLQRYPIVRETSDAVRSAMNTMIELGLMIGGAFAVAQMGVSVPGLGLMIYMLLYAANEALGRPIMRMAFGPLAAMLVGIALNVLHVTHLL